MASRDCVLRLLGDEVDSVLWRQVLPVAREEDIALTRDSIYVLLYMKAIYSEESG